MWKGQLVSINIAPTEAAPMQSVGRIQANAGEGLLGDRYASKQGSFSKKLGAGRQVTLIEIEAIEALQREGNITLSPADARRNLVTRDVPLNHLVGREFMVGEVILRGIRLCEPCEHLAKLTYPEVLPGLIHRGGLRADILRSGTIQNGDIIEEIPSKERIT